MSMNIDTVNGLFDEDDWGYIKDVVLDLTWKTTKIKLTNEQCKQLFLRLPRETQGLAVSWGMGDTPFRDDVHVFCEDNPDILNEIVNG